MVGGITRSVGLIAFASVCCLASNVVAQQIVENYAPISGPSEAAEYFSAGQHPEVGYGATEYVGGAPVVTPDSLPAAQMLETPLWPGEIPRSEQKFPVMRAILGVPPCDVTVTDGGIRTVGCSEYISDGGCSDAGCGGCGVGSCGAASVGLPTIGLPQFGCGGGLATGCPKRIGYFYEYLYMRTRNTDVAYAVPVDGPIVAAGGNALQVGPTEVVGLDYEDQDGYRFGGSLLLNDGAQITGRYTTFENSATSQVFAAAPDLLRSLISHPLANNAAVDSIRANARYDVEFEMADLTYQAHLFCNGRTTLDYVLGLRYAELDQRLNANFENNGVQTVRTDVDFHGFGPQIGLAFDHRIGCLGLNVYSKAGAAFIPGTSRGTYVQSDVFAGDLADTGWDSGCIMTQLDFEAGIGWWLGDTFNISAGYLVSAWLNTTTTAEFIDAVQTNDFNSIDGDGLTFDGLVLRADLRF